MPPFSAINHGELSKLISMASQAPSGCFVEVGVWKGGSAWHLEQLAMQQQRQIFLYDTFTGIPYKEAIDFHNVGDFSDTSYDEVKKYLTYATITKGIFPESAIVMPKVAFAHLDCDQYKSVKLSSIYLSKIMVPDGIIYFDDYALEGARKAVHELFEGRIEKTEFAQAFVRF